MGEPSGDRGEAAEEWAQEQWPPGLLREIAVEAFMAGSRWQGRMQQELRLAVQEAVMGGSVGLVAAEGDVPTPAGEAGRPADMGKRHG